MKPDTTHQFRLGPICSRDELEELWAIDNSAYGAASITYETFRDWWRAFPSGLLVLHWGRRIGGAIGLWPLSDRTAARDMEANAQNSDAKTLAKSFSPSPQKSRKSRSDELIAG